jgi:hypothetical protein
VREGLIKVRKLYKYTLGVSVHPRNEGLAGRG